MSDLNNMNWKAVKANIENQDAKIEKLRAELDAIKNLVMTQASVIQTLQANYARAYASLVRGGSTSHGDIS